MISKDDALQSVTGSLAEAALVDGVERVVIGEPIERSSYWVFSYDSAAAVDSGDFLKSLAGNGPVVVPKDGSPSFPLSTAEPISAQLDRLDHGLTNR